MLAELAVMVMKEFYGKIYISAQLAVCRGGR